MFLQQDKEKASLSFPKETEALNGDGEDQRAGDGGAGSDCSQWTVWCLWRTLDPVKACCSMCLLSVTVAGVQGHWTLPPLVSYKCLVCPGLTSTFKAGMSFHLENWPCHLWTGEARISEEELKLLPRSGLQETSTSNPFPEKCILQAHKMGIKIKQSLIKTHKFILKQFLGISRILSFVIDKNQICILMRWLFLFV